MRLSNFGRKPMKLSLLPAILLTTTASIAQAGGFEAQTLDTGFMYEEGAVLTASTASLNSNLTEANGAKILKDQNFTSFSIKSKVGPLDVGLTTYRSGAIQMSGAASPTLSPNPIPNADANIETLTALLKYDLSENFSVLAGINSDKLGTSVISTPAGRYDISSSSGTGYLAGVTYSRPEIALRVELRLQSESDLSTTTNYTSPTGTTPFPSPLATSLKRPQTMTLKIQLASGMAQSMPMTAPYRWPIEFSIWHRRGYIALRFRASRKMGRNTDYRRRSRNPRPSRDQQQL